MIGKALIPFFLVVVPATRGACPSNEALSVLQMDKIIGQWNGTHFYGDKTFCSHVEVTAQGEDKWSLQRISKSTGHIVNITLQQPDKKSGKLKSTDLAGSKSEIVVLAAEYSSHILLQECTPQGNVTTTFLRRPTSSKLITDAELETALYDANIRKERLQFCQETNSACKKWKTVVTPLDERRIQGVWREAGRIRTPGAVHKRNCISLALEPNRDRSGLSLRYTYNENGKTSCVSGDATYKYPEKKPAILTLNQKETGVAEFWILDTNYDSYVVVSLCSASFPGNQEDGRRLTSGVLVLTRNGVLTSADAFAINAAIISVGSNDFVQHLNPGFDQLDEVLDIVPQTCELDNTATCGVDFRMSSPLLICAFLLILFLR